MYEFRDIRKILILKMIYEVLRKVINVVKTCFLLKFDVRYLFSIYTSIGYYFRFLIKYTW